MANKIKVITPNSTKEFRESLSPATKAIIYNVLDFVLSEKEMRGPIIDLNKAMDRAEAMTGLHRKTLRKIRKEGETNKGVWVQQSRKPHPKKLNITETDKYVIQNKIQEYQNSNKMPSIKRLLEELKRDISFPGGKEHLRKLLYSMGYRYKKTNRKYLLENTPLEPICQVNIKVEPAVKVEQNCTNIVYLKKWEEPH